MISSNIGSLAKLCLKITEDREIVQVNHLSIKLEIQRDRKSTGTYSSMMGIQLRKNSSTI